MMWNLIDWIVSVIGVAIFGICLFVWGKINLKG